MLEKVPKIKRFEYFLLDKELKAQIDIAKKQYRGLGKAFISNKDNKNVSESLINKELAAKTIAKKKCKSDLIYNRLGFSSHKDGNKFDSLSFKSKYSYI